MSVSHLGGKLAPKFNGRDDVTALLNTLEMMQGEKACSRETHYWCDNIQLKIKLNTHPGVRFGKQCGRNWRERRRNTTTQPTQLAFQDKLEKTIYGRAGRAVYDIRPIRFWRKPDRQVDANGCTLYIR